MKSFLLLFILFLASATFSQNNNIKPTIGDFFDQAEKISGMSVRLVKD